MIAEESGLASLAIVALRVASALLADAAALVIAADVQARSSLRHILVVNALVRVAVAVACLARVIISGHTWLPLFLHKVWLALIAITTGSVVLALTVKLAILLNASFRMSITNASAPDFNVLNRVEVPFHHLLRQIGRHQVAVKRVQLEQSDSDL